MFVFWVCDSDEYQYMEWQGMRRLDASTAFGPLWHDTCWVQFLTVSDGDARNINEFGRQADEAMPEADAQMDVPDEDMEDVMPPGLPPRPPPPPAPAVATRGRSPPSLSPPRSRSRDLPSIPEDPVPPPWQWPQTTGRDTSMDQDAVAHRTGNRHLRRHRRLRHRERRSLC